MVAIDPGKATGVAFRDTVTETLWTCVVDDWTEVPSLVESLDPDIVHVEEYRLNAKSGSKSEPWSLKLYGALEQQARGARWAFSHLPASVAKSAVRRVATVPYPMRTPHERDAMRHLIVVLATRGDDWAKTILREGLK